MEQADVEDRVELASQLGEPDVEDEELGGKTALGGAGARPLDGGSGDVDSHDRQPAPGELEGVLPVPHPTSSTAPCASPASARRTTTPCGCPVSELGVAS